MRDMNSHVSESGNFLWKNQYKLVVTITLSWRFRDLDHVAGWGKGISKYYGDCDQSKIRASRPQRTSAVSSVSMLLENPADSSGPCTGESVAPTILANAGLARRLLVNQFEPMSHRAWSGAPFTCFPTRSSMLVGEIILRSSHRILLLKDDAFHLRSVTRKSDFNRSSPPIRWQFCVHVDPYLLHIK
jgi:hypothetical protein